MTRILPVLFGVLFATALGWPAAAQNPLAEPDPTQPAVPSPGELRPGWWSYLGQAPADQLESRARQLIETIDTAVLSLNLADSPEAIEFAERAKREIEGFANARLVEVPETAFNLRIEGEFSLSEYLESRRRYRLLAVDLQRESVELQELTDLHDLERRRVDQQLAEYTRISDPVARVTSGLEVIANRALLAVTQLRLERKQAQMDELERQRQAYAEQALYARRNLTAESFDLGAATTRMTELQEALAEAKRATRAAKDALLDLNPADEFAGIRASYSRQRLLAANLDEHALAVELAMTRGSIAWFRLRQAEDDRQIDEARALLEEIGNVLTQVEENLPAWRRSGEQLLLAQDPAQVRDREIRLLRDRSRELGQENLQALRSLELEHGILVDLVDVIGATIAAEEGGVTGVWRRFTLALSDLWSRFSALADSALFRWGDVPVTPIALIQMVLILITGFFLSSLFRRGLEQLGRRRHLHDRSSLYMLGRIAHYLIIVAAVFLALGSLGFDFTGVALVAGALSVGIGFGLQNIVNNFVSGLILMFDRSLKIGDYIELDSGLTGVVREIKVRSTRINTNDNVDILVPNSEFFNSRLINWTHADGLGRFRIPFGVAYGSDKETVRKAALEAAEDVDYTLHNMPGKEPEVWLVNFGDSSLDFILLVWVSRQGVRRPTRVRSAYLWAIETRLREHGIEIPFPQRDLHLRSGFPSISEPPRAADDPEAP